MTGNQMNDSETNSIKTDIALIKKDVKQIERVFQKIDDAVMQMTNVIKNIAVQENILQNNEKRIASLEEKSMKNTQDELDFRKELNQKLEDMKNVSDHERDRRHKEVLDAINKSNQKLSDKLDHQDKRINSLENWRWYILGIGAVIIFILSKFPFSSFF
jgi:DNA repair ATPase RecN